MRIATTQGIMASIIESSQLRFIYGFRLCSSISCRQISATYCSAVLTPSHEHASSRSLVAEKRRPEMPSVGGLASCDPNVLVSVMYTGSQDRLLRCSATQYAIDS